jgi:uncharacterized membrane protein YfcA
MGRPGKGPATMRRISSRFIWFTVIVGLFLIAVSADLVRLTLETFVVILLCASLELVDSSLGMGYGTTLTPLLLLLGFEPLDLVPTILVSEFLSGFASSFFHSEAGNVRFTPGSHHLRAAVILSVCSVAGVAGGVHLAFEVSPLVMRRIIGTIILAVGVYVFMTRHRTHRFSTIRIVVLALIASFNKAISGGGYGPLLTSGQIMGGVHGRAAVAITSLAEGFTCLVGVILFVAAGQMFELELLIPVATGALFSVPFSAHIVRRIGEAHMRWAIAVTTLVLGTLTIVKTL